MLVWAGMLNGDETHAQSKVAAEPGTVNPRPAASATEPCRASRCCAALNMSFFGTSMRAFDDDNATGAALVTDLTFDGLDFAYPSASRRMLGDLSPIDCMAVWTNARNPSSSAADDGDDGGETDDGDAPLGGCFKELSSLCHADAHTMNETQCLACVAQVSHKFRSCSVKRADAICTKPRPAGSRCPLRAC